MSRSQNVEFQITEKTWFFTFFGIILRWVNERKKERKKATSLCIKNNTSIIRINYHMD